MKKKLKLVALHLMFLAMGVQATYAGHFTETLPPASPVNSMVTSNGYDWQTYTQPSCSVAGSALTWNNSTLAPGCILDDYLLYVGTTTQAIANTTNVSTFTVVMNSSGSVGTATIPAGWWANGKTLKFTARGTYGTTGTPTISFGLAIGTATIVSIPATAAPSGQTAQTFSETGYITCNGATATSSCIGDLEVILSTGLNAGGNMVFMSSSPTNYTTAAPLNAAQTFFPTVTWGTANASNTIQATVLLIELLN